jgi:hypothetical protein
MSLRVSYSTSDERVSWKLSVLLVSTITVWIALRLLCVPLRNERYESIVCGLPSGLASYFNMDLL